MTAQMTQQAKQTMQVVVGLIQHADCLLLAQRPQNKPYAGYWEFPGGKLEDNETAIDALKRELWEELGINITQASYYFDHEHLYTNKLVQLTVWQVLSYEGEPYGRENQSLVWKNLDEIIYMPLLEGNYKIITKLRSLARL